MHLFHKWIYLQKNITKEFLGDKYQTPTQAGLRICTVCKKAQKYVDYGEHSKWVDLNQHEMIILGKKLTTKEVFKGTKDEN